MTQWGRGWDRNNDPCRYLSPRPMGCSASAESVLGEGSFTIDTRGVSTKAVGASAGIRFGVHRIAKAELNSGKEQDRFSFLLRENAQQQPTESDESASASNWNAETGGSFALGIFDGHGETPKAADIAADRLLKRVFENHFKFVQTNIDSPPPSPNPSGFSKSPSMEDLTKALALPKRDPGKREKVRSPRENTREELKEIDHDDTDVVLEAFRKALVPYLAPGSAKKGEVVMSQGDSGDFVVFVAEGSVDVSSPEKACNFFIMANSASIALLFGQCDALMRSVCLHSMATFTASNLHLCSW